MHLAIRSSTLPSPRPLRRLLPAATLAVLLGGCAGASDLIDGMISPTSGGSDIVTADSLTVQRVRGSAPDVAPLLPEPGNVWPDPEPERPTLLGGPDEAFRNIPEYRPSLIEGAPPARSPVPTPAPGARRGSGSTLDRLPPPRDPPRFSATPPQPGIAPPPPRSGVGQVVTDPSGRPATVTNEAGRVRGVTQPGVGGGAVIRDGNVETWIGPDGRTSTRIVPQ